MTWKLLKKLGYDPFFRSGNLVPSIVIFASWMFLEYRATSGAVGKLFYPICFCRTSNVGCMFAAKYGWGNLHVSRVIRLQGVPLLRKSQLHKSAVWAD